MTLLVPLFCVNNNLKGGLKWLREMTRNASGLTCRLTDGYWSGRVGLEQSPNIQAPTRIGVGNSLSPSLHAWSSHWLWPSFRSTSHLDRVSQTTLTTPHSSERSTIHQCPRLLRDDARSRSPTHYEFTLSSPDFQRRTLFTGDWFVYLRAGQKSA